MRLLAASLLTLAAATLVAGPPVRADAAAPPARTFPAAVEAVDLGPAFRGAHPAVLGLDGAFSLPLRPGRSVWVFGDTLLGRWEPGGRRRIEGMPANTAAYVDDADWVTGFPHAAFAGSPHPAAVIHTKGRPADRRVWPLDLVKAGGHTWAYFVEIAPGGEGPINFRVTGTGVAMLKPGPPLRFEAAEVLWDGAEPSFGASALAHGDHVYLYAGGVPTRLARVPAGRPDERKAYEYWDGKGWSRDVKAAAALPDSGPEVSVRPSAHLGGFLMVYVPPFGKAAVARFATAPEGPWSEPRKLFDCQPAGDDVATFYGAKQHAELDRDGGREIVVSYNTNAPEARLADRPELYWPRLVRVAFGKAPSP